MLAAALALALHPAAAPDRAPTRIRPDLYAAGPWRLRVTRDAFARTTTCRIGDRDGEVRHGVLLWSLGSDVDTSRAVWRIDAGEPRRQALLDLPASANLDNPSDGRLAVPVALLAGARWVETRPSPRAHVRRLNVAQLDDLLVAADRLGCARP
ncbi:MAG: hypothetical protein INR64_05575 [Caulobacteraceae bacterium]|nr:hypothetical protein [Caulobacter sp.]